MDMTKTEWHSSWLWPKVGSFFPMGTSDKPTAVSRLLAWPREQWQVARRRQGKTWCNALNVASKDLKEDMGGECVATALGGIAGTARRGIEHTAGRPLRRPSSCRHGCAR